MSSASVRSGVAVRPRRILGGCPHGADVVAFEEMFEQPPIRRRRRVVKLVDNHDVERSRIELLQIHLGQRLNGGKHVPPLVGPVAVHVEFAEVSRPQDLAECAEALLQDFLPMRHKQQAQVAVLVAQALVVQRGDDGLAGSGGGDDKILEAVMPVALYGELFEHLALVGPGFDVQEEERRLQRVVLGPAPPRDRIDRRRGPGCRIRIRGFPSTCRTWRRTSRGCRVSPPAIAARSIPRRPRAQTSTDSKSRCRPWRSRCRGGTTMPSHGGAWTACRTTP